MPILPTSLEMGGPQPQTLYPSFSTSRDAMAYAKACLPITDKNQLVAILAMYRNSLLKEIHENQSSQH